MVQLALLLFLAPLLSSSPVLILTSNQHSLYPLDVPSICLALISQAECLDTTSEDELTIYEKVANSTAAIVLDLTGSLKYGLRLALMTEEVSFYHIHSLREALFNSRSHTFWPDTDVERDVVDTVLEHYNWTKPVVVGSNDPLSVDITRKYREKNEGVISFIFPSEISQTDLADSLLANIKSSGRNVVILAGNPSFTLKALTAFQLKQMLKPGYVFIILSNSIPDGDWTQQYEGVLYVTPVCDSTLASRQSIWTAYLSAFVSQYRSNELPHGRHCLWNAQRNHTQKVVEIDSGHIRASYDNVTFPGGTHTPPGSVLSVLISISTSVNNPTIGPNTEYRSLGQSSVLAVNDVNSRLGLIPNFELDWTPVEYGFFEWDRSWAAARIAPSIGKLGSALVGSPASGTTIGLTRLLADLNASIPIIGPMNTSPLLSSPSTFPLFVRDTLSDARSGEIYAQIIKYYGWTKCNLLYQNGSLWGEGVYSTFRRTGEMLGVEIVNPEELRTIDNSLDVSHYQRQLEAIVKTKVRVMVFIVNPRCIPVLLGGMYALEMRRGDAIFVAVEWLSVSIFSQVPEPLLSQMQELLEGSIMTASLGFRSLFGQTVFSEMQSMGINPGIANCLYYDGTLMAAHALSYLIHSGKDYEDPKVMIKELRTTKFMGCSGLVYIEEGTNDRARMAFQVYNLQKRPGNDTWTTEQVLIFDPESTQIFQKTGYIKWPGGSTLPPSDTILDGTCPDERRLKSFPKGEELIVGVGLGLLVIISGITGVIWKKWWRVEYPELTTQHEISMEDYLMFAGLGIEFFQILGMGPDITGLTHLVAYVSEASSLNFNTLALLGEGMYWVIVDSIFAGCITWSILLVATVSNAYARWNLSTLGSISEWLLPFLGDSCFLPIVSQLMELFICDRSYDGTYSGSVLANDCHFKCWGTTHSLYVTGSAVLLIAWVPAAVFTRPLWQQLRNVLHVKTQPAYLLLATVFQITLIVLNKTLKRAQPMAHIAVYIAMVAGMAVWLLIARPHNYARANMWHVGMYCAALWMGLISLTSEVLCEVSITSVLLFVGWALIAATCMILQTVRYKSLLYRKPRKDTRKLFRFAFTFHGKHDLSKIDFNRLTTVRDYAKTMQDNTQQFTLQPTKSMSIKPESKL